MPEHTEFRPDTTSVAEHPAVRAWEELGLAMQPPESVEVLTTRQGKPPNRKSAIYRLNSAGVDGTPVIAKRGNRSTIEVERVVYQEILPQVPVTSLICYGSVDDDSSEFSWLFLEDSKGVPYDEEEAGHLTLAAEWLGITHTSTGRLDLAERLPSHRPDRYSTCTSDIRETITQNISNPSLNDADIHLLHGLLARCDRIESNWSELEFFCNSMPQCLVHGDFVSKNVRVRGEGPASQLYVMDWDISGWGTPAVDTERLDLSAYWGVVRKCWPRLNFDEIQTLANFGVVLRNIGLIAVTCMGLVYEWVDDTMGQLRSYESDLAQACRRVGWV